MTEIRTDENDPHQCAPPTHLLQRVSIGVIFVISDFSSKQRPESETVLGQAHSCLLLAGGRHFLAPVPRSVSTPAAQGDGGTAFRRFCGTKRPQSTIETVPGAALARAAAIFSVCRRSTGQEFVERIRMPNGLRQSCCSASIRLSFVINASKTAASIASSSLPFFRPLNPSSRTLRTS
jgi:hypothetical protein